MAVQKAMKLFRKESLIQKENHTNRRLFLKSGLKVSKVQGNQVLLSLRLKGVSWAGAKGGGVYKLIYT